MYRYGKKRNKGKTNKGDQKMALSQTMSLGTRQTQSVSLIEYKRTMDFWDERISKFKDCMGAPGEYIKALLQKHRNEKIVEKIILAEEQMLFREVFRIIQLLMENQFSLHADRKIPTSILEVGCGTGNFTLELAKFRQQSNGPIELVTGDISPAALSTTRAKLSSHGYSDLIPNVHQIVASSLMKKIDDPLMASQKVLNPQIDRFDLIVMGRIGHRLLGEAWGATYREINKLLKSNGVIIFYEPLQDMNYGRIMDNPMREFKTSDDYHSLFKKRLKMQQYVWNRFAVFNQVYVIGAFEKQVGK